MTAPNPSKKTVFTVARNDFKSFVRLAFGMVFPGNPFADNFHITTLCYEMEQILAGNCRRLAINMPPRTLKSFIVSVAFPAFMLGHDPTKKLLVISHGENLLNEHSSSFRTLLSHPDFHQVFPTLGPKPNKNTERVYTTSQGGARTAVTTMSGLTGMGADIIIFDDPISATDAANESACEKTADWIKQSALTRFNNAASDPAILVMQRLSIWDPHAALTSLGGWKTLIFPAQNSEDRQIETGPGHFTHWKKGELLHEKRLPKDFLEEQKKVLGEHAYKAQFLQMPIPFGSGMIDVDDFKFFEKYPRDKPDVILLSIDPASGGPYAKSYSVILIFYVFDGDMYLHARWRQKAKLVELKNITFKLIRHFKPNELIIENASNGPGLADEVDHFLHKERLNGSGINTNLHAFSPKGSKEERADIASLFLSEGRVHVWHPSRAPWINEFLDECRAFPEGKNDDQVDALSQALIGYHRLYDQVIETKVHLF
ncbi:phage terminase large subunit [Hyphobacterium sp. HN65]|uniref:Phage terminase large subunit n=1 Tax=Hyphobacterium lacteum TaxID=3116575 RepID=A0ABU7LPK8_9PROT|nr:phage terminase large subunit [Hyphobacterium sp. HN65]MEE2525843.1 phage terminase large subunit [Hyphobacterium sp. HN65]